MAHAITIETDRPRAVDNHGEAYDVFDTRYRWHCCCGRVGGWTLSRARSARNGGARHVAAMERTR